MAETTWTALRDLLVVRYADLKGRLTRQFGSEELASESLHEAWLRLDKPGAVGPVNSEPAYLFRMVANIALDLLRAEKRRARQSEIEELVAMPTTAPDPARVAAARHDLEVVERAIRSLPPRMQTILIAARLDGLTHRQIAEQLGLSRRMVLYELQRAIEHLDAALDERRQDCAGEPPRSS